jgi:hypothetical protein
MAQDDALLKAARAEARSKMQSGEITTQEEYDSFMSGKGLSKPKAAEAPTAKAPVAETPQPKAKAAESWSTRGKGLSVAREALGQGLGFGFGDEAEALVSSLISPKSYQDELQRIRGEMKEFEEAYPKTVLASQAAGGIAAGGGLARGALAGVKGASAVARALTKSAALQGALGGAGGSDEGLGNRAIGAGTGALIGGALGRAGGMLAGKAAQVAKRGAMNESAGVSAIREAMSAGKMTPDMVRNRAQQLATDAPSSRAMDVLGEPGVRIGRRIQAIGGEAGEDIGKAMTERTGAIPERLQQALTRTTKMAGENMLETVDEIATRRKALADPLYEAVKQQAPVVSDELEKLIASRPSLRQAASQAQNLMAESGVKLPTMSTAGGPTPLRTPEYLDYMKRALDDMLYMGKRPGPGGLGLTEQRSIAQTRRDFIDMLDMSIPGYQEARAAWAGETAFINAIETGQDFASKKVAPRDIVKALETMPVDEQEFVQRGWLDAQRESISEMRLRPSEIKTPKYREKVEAIFGDKADDIISALDAEVQLTANANAIMSGSRTAPLAVDIAQEMAPTKAGRLIRKLKSPKETALTLAEEGVNRAGEFLGGPRAAARRGEKAQALLTPTSSMSDLLGAVEREYAARARGAAVGNRVAAPLGGLSGRETVRRLRGEL